jgi:beta-glucosidase
MVRYGEGIFVGYRYYDRKKLAPLFPFGHGLSYTSFEYSNLRLSAQTIQPGEELTVNVDVRNSGQRPGKEVVQLYVRDVASTVARPEKELKAFHKVALEPNETKTLSFTLGREAFWYFDSARNAWATEPGEFEVLVGASSRDIRQQGRFYLAQEPRSARLHPGCTLDELRRDPQARAVLDKYLGWAFLTESMAGQGELTVMQLREAHPTLVTQHALTQIERELAAID